MLIDYNQGPKRSIGEKRTSYGALEKTADRVRRISR